MGQWPMGGAAEFADAGDALAINGILRWWEVCGMMIFWDGVFSIYAGWGRGWCGRLGAGGDGHFRSWADFFRWAFFWGSSGVLHLVWLGLFERAPWRGCWGW